MLNAALARISGVQRPEQVRMHDAVQEAVQTRVPLLVQAGTGTGKSLAYLTATAGTGRTIIATATNQLSEQLLNKDLPVVQQACRDAGIRVSYAQLKGRSNYVCLARLRANETLEQHDTTTKDSSTSVAGKAAARLYDWAGSTTTGDRSEAPVVPDTVWRGISVTSSQCLGSTCPFYSECFTERARKKARAADIVVTNHALLAQDIRAMNAGADNSIFGDYDTVIIDEAHDFAAAVTDALSFTVHPASATTTVDKAARVLRNTDEDSALAAAREALEIVENSLSRMDPGPLAAMPDTLREQLSSCAHHLLPLIRLTREAAESQSTKAQMTAKGVSEALADECEAIVEAATDAPGNVTWVTQDKGQPRLHVAPLRIGHAMEPLLSKAAIVGTSATLTVDGSFDPLQQTWELPSVTAVDVGTPFDHGTQGILYLPDSSMPEPVGRDRREHSAAVLDRLTALVRAAGGRTLALFTTTAATRAAGEHLAKEFPGLTVLVQGEAPADMLVQQFRDEETSVLCATMGLWQGVDVPGASCSLVVVDKIPFPPPDDALAAARKTDLDARGQDGFHLVFVSAAATNLAQAAGRLIRRDSDRGVVAVLDPRLRTKRYGSALVGSLPSFHTSNDLEEVSAALTRLTGGLDPTQQVAPRKQRARGASRASKNRSESRRKPGTPPGGASKRGNKSVTRKRMPPRRTP